MKKLFASILALTMALSLAACSSSTTETTTTETTTTEATTTETTEATFTTVEDGKLYMATNAAFPPYEMIADDGSYEGIDVEIATAIAASLGLELVVDDMDFGTVIIAVQNGKSDIAMAGLTVTDERKQNVDFSDSYATGIQVVIVADGGAVQSIDDMEGDDIMIGTQEGTTGYIYCSAPVEEYGYGEEHVIAYANGATAVQALMAGKVDCVVIDNQPAIEFVAANEGLSILDTEFAVEDYAIGVSKDNTALSAAINEALAALIADGTVQSIVDKYIVAE
ncbi:ABC transporter substrate-binding protein [Bengtsoniella intestinalis]|uniref:ABC transporter substrate-binding protein n=1 Tax=Bengtsoniella intestinalis TaxID=3073143 RepID=UPI00391FB8D1